MHIALFVPGWPIEVVQNGIVTYVHWTKPEFERLGHKVSVFAGGIGEGEYPNVYLIRRSFAGRWGRRLIKRFVPLGRDIFKFGSVVAEGILEVHRRDPIDVIEMEESFGWFAAVARITKIPLVVKLHGPAFLSQIDEELCTPFGMARVEYEGRALLAAEAIAAPCKITLDQTVERYGLHPSFNAHIHNPLAMDDTIPKWRFDACDRNTILFVGRFDKRKGADILLRAFRLLLEVRPRLRLIFVGPDIGIPQFDGSRLGFDQFCHLLFPGTLRNQINFLGSIPNRDIARLRLDAMVTVVASRWENPGYTALEAMYQCCPVVCSDAGGCVEIIEHGRTGLLARTEDPEDFAEKIAAMLDSPASAVSMGLAARASVIERNSADTVARNSIRLYEQVVAKHRGERSRT